MRYLILYSIALFSAANLAAVEIGSVSFTPTHVWSGGAGTTAFETQGNWQDANGDPVAAPPSAESIVFIPAPASGSLSVEVASAFTIGALYVGRETGAEGSVTVTFNHCRNNIVNGDVHLFAGATFTAKLPEANHAQTFAQEASSSYKVNIVASGSFTIDSGASVNLTDRGFWKNNPATYKGGDRSGGPASYAGLNLRGVLGEFGNAAVGKGVYGSIYFPTNLGASSAYKLGGGATYLKAGGNMVVNGSILANAADTFGGYNNEMIGCGGSILLECAAFSGAGTISASSKYTTNSNGSGGRIAVHQSVGTDMSGFTGTIAATTYANDLRGSGAGTIYLRFAGQALEDGELIVDNGSSACGYYQVTEFPEDDYSFGKVTVRGGARLHLKDGQVLRIRRGLDTTGGSLTNDATAVVDCSYPGNVTIVGNNQFGGFVCTNENATLHFASGDSSLFTFVEGGSVHIAGGENRRIPLVAEPANEEWRAALIRNVAVDIGRVAVSNSNASAGSVTFLTIDSSDLGGNVNWAFSEPILPGDPMTWTGGFSTAWGDSRNWVDKHSGHRTPVATDAVTIPSGLQNNPELPADMRIDMGSIVIQGSLFMAAGAILSASGDVTVSGALQMSDKSILSVGGDCTFADGSSFVPSTGEVRLVGSGNQSVDLDGRAFNCVVVSKAGGTVTFADGFSAAMLDLRATGAVSVLFAPGKTVSTQALLASGYVSGAAQLSLGPSGAGTWALHVVEKGLATAVNVTGCDASGGVAVLYDSYSTVANSQNWILASRIHIWNGPAAGDTYETAANWTPNDGNLSGSHMAVRAISDMAITLGEAATAESLEFYPGTYNVTFTQSAALTVNSNFVARSGAAMVFNKAVAVNGDVAFRSGSSLTHSEHVSTDTSKKYAVDISSSGNVTIESGVSISVADKGFAPKKGPGYGGGAVGPVPTHGGRYSGWGTDKACYGSILAPVTLGSGGYGKSGGGAVKISAAGTLTLNSNISANSSAGQYANSAGSVYLVCSRLVGTGSVTATAGNYSSSYGGSGGRVAIVQTQATDFSGWTGVAQARGSYYSDTTKRLGGAGPVYLKSAGSGAVIFEDRRFVTNAEAQVPMADDGDASTVYSDLDFIVPSNMTISLRADITVRDLDLQSTTSRIRLNGYTMTVKSATHRDGRRWGASYENLVTEGGGSIVWIGKPGFSVTVR